MCFIAILPEHQIAHIAEEDIECYKVYIKTGDFYDCDSFLMCSPYLHFPYLHIKYHKSRTLTAKISPEKVQGKYFSIGGPKNTIVIEEGIHAYRSNKFLGRYAKAIIPKGTLYYMNDVEIVAEKMIIYNPYPIEGGQ